MVTSPMSPRLSRAEQQAQTRSRLIDAAEALFAEVGIATASIEDIAARAGYSRGAFYSNFADKNELVMAVLEVSCERNDEELDQIAADAGDPADFFVRLRAREVDQSRRTLGLEYVLYAIRNPEARTETKRIHDASRKAMTRLLEDRWAGFDVEMPIDVETAARVLEALDDGIDMLRRIDPDGFPLGMFTDVLTLLEQAALALGRADS